MPFTLSEKETFEALRLVTRFGEIGADPLPKPEMIGLELHRSAENIRKTVLGILDELSTTRDADSKKPILMRAAEHMAIRYALERFQSGDLKVNAVHQLLEEMGQQMSNLRKLLDAARAEDDQGGNAGRMPPTCSTACSGRSFPSTARSRRCFQKMRRVFPLVTCASTLNCCSNAKTVRQPQPCCKTTPAR